jgi:hypothetical protein
LYLLRKEIKVERSPDENIRDRLSQVEDHALAWMDQLKSNSLLPKNLKYMKLGYWIGLCLWASCCEKPAHKSIEKLKLKAPKQAVSTQQNVKTCLHTTIWQQFCT